MVPSDLAERQLDVWELLLEGLVHVFLEVRGLHILYDGGLQRTKLVSTWRHTDLVHCP